MSFTLEELEAHCARFEKNFTQGQKCLSIRNMLTKMAGGQVTMPTPSSSFEKSSQPLEQTLTIVKHHEQKEEEEKETPKTSPKSVKAPTYLELVAQLGDPVASQERYMWRRRQQYKLMHYFGILKNQKFVQPWDFSPGSLLVWSWVVNDFCTTLVEERGVEVLSGGAIVEIHLDEICAYVSQIRNIILSSQLLSRMEFPMLEALEQKLFLTFVMLS